MHGSARVLTAGIDIGGSAVQVSVLDGDGTRRGSARLRTPADGDRVGVLDVVEAAILEVADDAGVKLGEVDAIGVGTPGVVIAGTVGGATNVPGWFERFELAELLGTRLDRPIRVANDITCAAVGEHHAGAAQGHDHVLVVFVGTGVGAGLILNGRPYEGAVGGAGEFGHMPVTRGGAVCPCGRRGCVEAYAGRRAMALAAERAVAAGRTTILFDLQDELGERRPTAAVFAEALRRGDELAADLLDDGVEALGAGIGSAANLLDVEVVLLGGTVTDALGRDFVYRVEAAARPHLFLQPPHVKLLQATLGGEAAALGAALLARDAVPA